MPTTKADPYATTSQAAKAAKESILKQAHDLYVANGHRAIISLEAEKEGTTLKVKFPPTQKGSSSAKAFEQLVRTATGSEH